MQKKKYSDDYETKRKIKMARRRIITVSFLGVILVTVLGLCFMFFAPSFNVKNIVCEGNSKISEETILQKSELVTGKNTFSQDLGKARNNIASLEYVEGCTVKRVFPNTIKIYITECSPAAYFSVGTQLAVTDTNGKVIEVVANADDATEIVNMKVSNEEEALPSPSATPSTEETKDNMIWGYDDDGDPIYKVNGGHYEFDDDGNRYFVDDSQSSADPDETPEVKKPDSLAGKNFDELEKTENGTIVYNAPIVYGVGVTKYSVGDKITTQDEAKLGLVLSGLKSLKESGLLERATKIDVENLNDVKVYIEDRLEILYGTFDEFDYKTRFVTSVINNSLSAYEEAVLDFRDSKLYVRSADSESPKMVEPTSSPGTKNSPNKNSDEEETVTPSPKPDEEDENVVDNADNINSENPDDEVMSSDTKSKSKTKSESGENSTGGKHTATPKSTPTVR